MSDKKPTIQDIADLAKVSKSTVSRVLNDTTPVNEDKRQSVEAAMKELNFQPNIFARGLASGNSMTIGILTQKLGSPFYDAVNQGVIRRLLGTGYSPIFVDGQWQEHLGKTALQVLLGRQVDGVVVVGGNLPISPLNELKEREGIALVVVAREIESLADHCIYIDNFQAAYDATKFLIESGHRKIAHITGIPSHQDSVRRQQGYTEALIDAGVEVDSNLIVQGNFDFDSGSQAVEKLLSNNLEFTAIFCASDSMAFGARLELYRRSIRVPQEVSLIGFDDQPMAAFSTPPLTTVRQPASEMGQAAADVLLKMLKKKDVIIPELQATLVLRESVCKLVD